MAPESPAIVPAPEFYSDAHRAEHVRGLAAEKSGYDAKATGAESRGDKVAADLYKGRASQVDAELKRLAADAKPASRRAETR